MLPTFISDERRQPCPSGYYATFVKDCSASLPIYECVFLSAADYQCWIKGMEVPDLRGNWAL